jgi:Ca2+-binding EF-hand superfamily protein
MRTGSRIIRTYDHNRSGKLEQDEVAELLEDLNEGCPVREDLVRYMLTTSDINEDGAIDAMEVHALRTRWFTFAQTRSDKEELMAKYDTDGSGNLSLDELQAMLTDLNMGKPVSRAVARYVFIESDLSENGVIDLPELDRVLSFWSQERSIFRGGWRSQTCSVQ